MSGLENSISTKTIEPYAPLVGLEGFGILTTWQNARYLVRKDTELKLKLKPGGTTPKSALLFWDALAGPDNMSAGKTVLDLGTGETGILAAFTSLGGAQRVDAVDIVPSCTDWLNVVVEEAGLKNVNVICGDLFDAVKGKKYDVILSNPPQTPMQEGSAHDSGGPDGRTIIRSILTQSGEHLAPGGKLLFRAYDYLGIMERTSRDIRPLKDEILDAGFKQVSLICSGVEAIRQDGVTAASLPYIKSVYPNAEFRNAANGRIHHNISIICCEH
jgi:hypothetical protein